MADAKLFEKAFVTSDNVRLNFFQAGRGPVLVLLHGWSQCSVLFSAQVGALSRLHTVFALDMRGHGGSEKLAYGYHISRLAKDLDEFLRHIGIYDSQSARVSLLGHSMGCAVIWSYVELFGTGLIDRLVLVDEGACLLVDPAWSSADRDRYGAIFSADAAFDMAARLSGDDGVAITRDMIGAMFTDGFPSARLDAVIRYNLQMPRQFAATLLLSNIFNDWRGLVARIDRPVLVIGAEASVTATGACAWLAEQIPGARLEIFAEDEGGSHFMFLENPEKFNAIVQNFLA